MAPRDCGASMTASMTSPSSSTPIQVAQNGYVSPRLASIQFIKTNKADHSGCPV
jgi:hypothetical protein